jgi:hypothetical protein
VNFTSPLKRLVTKFCGGTLVHVTIAPGDEATRDEGGLSAHLLWELRTRKNTSGDAWEDVEGDAADWSIETDACALWWPIPGEVYVVGGVGKWVVSTWRTPRPWPGHAQELWLTREYDDEPVIVPQGHTHFRLVGGTLVVNGRANVAGAEWPAAHAPSAVAVGFVQTGLRTL